MATLPVISHGLSGGAVQVLTSTVNAHTCIVGSGGQVKCFGKSVVNTPSGDFNGVLGRCYARTGSGGPDYSRSASLCWDAPSAYPSDRFGILPTDMSTALAATPLPGLVTAPATGLTEPASVGGQHFCAILRSFGGVACWGANSYGQLGNDQITHLGAASNDFDAFQISMPATLGFVPLQLALGSNHSCSLMSDNTVRCWGAGSVNQNGHGSDTRDVLGSATSTIYNGM